jgi:hypothetical protein
VLRSFAIPNNRIFIVGSRSTTTKHLTEFRLGFDTSL